MQTSQPQKIERNLSESFYQNNGSHEGFSDGAKIFGRNT